MMQAWTTQQTAGGGALLSVGHAGALFGAPNGIQTEVLSTPAPPAGTLRINRAPLRVGGQYIVIEGD